jgi:hypothetical protein
MVIIASLWGMWHIVSGMACALWWRRQDRAAPPRELPCLIFDPGATVDRRQRAARRQADVGVQDGRIAEVGRVSAAARETVTGRGAWLTPGFVDIHTHYDGQATGTRPSQPQHPPRRDDAGDGQLRRRFRAAARRRAGPPDQPDGGRRGHPGRRAGRGHRFNWESFPQYMDAARRAPHSLDFLPGAARPAAHVRDGRARAWRRRRHTEDIAAMRGLLREALQAGAIGFSTGRSDNHRTSRARRRRPRKPTRRTDRAGRCAFAGLGMASCNWSATSTCCVRPERFDAEFDLVEQLARAAADRCR